MINEFLINNAHAQAGQPAEAFTGSGLIPLVLIFIIFYVFIIRPQNKKFKDHKDFVDNLKTGNKVITSSGIYGVIRKIDSKNNKLSLEIADDVIIEISKNNISELEKKEKDKDNKNQNKKSK